MVDGVPSGRQKKILVIEDEAVQRHVISEKLMTAGYDVVQANDGQQGLQKALGNQPDLILLDNRMPTMSGFEMLKRLRETSGWGARVPVIFFSNVQPASTEEWGDIDATGASHYLMKSETSLDEIVKKVREVLQN